MLDEFIRVTGFPRKAAIRLLNGGGRRGSGKRLGRRRKCGKAAQGALKAIGKASERLCSKRLRPFLPEMVRVLRQHGEQRINAFVEEQLCQMSPSTIDRLLRPYRRIGWRKSLSTTKPASLLKRAIPIRTFADWEEDQPGFMETDLVAHCGESTDGFYLNTLCAVDVASGWTEYLPVWGKWQERVRQAVHHMRQRVHQPVPLQLLSPGEDYFYQVSCPQQE